LGWRAELPRLAIAPGVRALAVAWRRSAGCTAHSIALWDPAFACAQLNVAPVGAGGTGVVWNYAVSAFYDPLRPVCHCGEASFLVRCAPCTLLSGNEQREVGATAVTLAKPSC